MLENEKLLKKRFIELSSRADSQLQYTYSDFLTLWEQNILADTKLNSPYNIIGGYIGAERKIARFGDEQVLGEDENFPACWLCISPSAPKFAQSLTHRDFLGSLTSLGITRAVLGDIIIHENKGYIFCMKSITEYIKQELTKVKHTNVYISYVDSPPEKSISFPEKKQVIVPSERLDAIIASVYNISRTQSQKLFQQDSVFVNSRLTVNTSLLPEYNSIISVRGHGRFIYEGVERETKKGRLRVSVRVF